MLGSAAQNLVALATQRFSSSDYQDYNIIEDKSLHSYGGHHGGHGGHSFYDDCCPLVIDAKTFVALISFIGLATYFLQQRIGQANLVMPGRKKRSFDFLKGNQSGNSFTLFTNK